MQTAFKKGIITSFIFFISLYALLPANVLAQWGQNVGGTTSRTYFGQNCEKPPQNFKDFICISLQLVELTIIFAASSAVLAFIWGLSKFILGAGNEEKIAEGKMIMKWGLIGLFFMFTIWGVIWAITLGIGFTFGIPLLPQ